MNTQLKLSGIYDLRAFELAHELGVKNFGFDLRPLSCTFIQTHVLKKLWESLRNYKDLGELRFSLHFSNEKLFVIESFLKLFEDAFLGRDSRPQIDFLYSGPLEEGFVAFCLENKIPWWHDIKELNEKAYLNALGGEFAYSKILYIFNHRGDQGLSKWVKDWRQANPGLSLSLNTTWDMPPLLGPLEEINPLYVSVYISPEVELNYRNIDLIKLHRCLGAMSSHLALASSKKAPYDWQKHPSHQ